MGTLSLRRNSWFSDRLRKVGLEHLEESVSDPELRARLTPDYEPGCKRRCISDDYLSTFNRSNVHLVTDRIARIERDGVRDASGKLHPVDVIVEATGFRPFDITDYVNIVGRDGKRLRDVWGDRVEVVPHGDGLRVSELLHAARSEQRNRPHLGADHDRVAGAVRDAQSRVHERVTASPTSIPDPDVVRRYNDRLQKDMQKMVFSGGCNAWYTDSHDRNFTLWPYSALRFLDGAMEPQTRRVSRQASVRRVN